MRHALAYVAGFGAVFTVLGITATFAAGPIADYLPALRVIGGLILIVLGLDLAGLLHISWLQRTWRPLDAGAAGSLATATGSTALGSGADAASPASATGSVAMSSARAAAGSRRSGSGRSSPSAGARASASSSAGS